MKTKLSGILTLLLAFVVQVTFAQERTITGSVSDETGPLPGVSVLIEGTTTGTETDFDGNYSIEANSGDVLRFSFVGMTTVTRSIGAESTINVTMVSEANTLDEVVVTAFGAKRQAKSLGYATTKVTGDQLREVSAQNPLESLSGKVAGVDISSPAQPGASTKVIFRGISSITGSNAPLYVVDGSPILDIANGNIGTSSSFDAGTGINDLDPNTIETINFLKGASATSLYGSRGANGVIVITTKRGRDKLNVSVSTSLDFHEVSRIVHSQQEFGTGWDGQSWSFVAGEGSFAASNENGSWGAKFNGEVRPWSRVVNNSQLIKPYVLLENNKKDFYDIGISSNTSIGISGGSDNSDVAFTYSRQDSDGVIPTDNDSFAKHNFGVNAGIKLIDKLEIRTAINYTRKDQKAVPTGFGDDAGFGQSLQSSLLQMPNDVSIVDMQDESLIFNQPSFFYTPYAQNPYTTLNSTNIDIAKDRVYGNVSFTYHIMDNLSATFQASQDVDNETVKRYADKVPLIEGSPNNVNGDATINIGAVQENKYTNIQTDYFFNLNYNLDITEDLRLDALAGYNFNERQGDWLSVTVTDLSLPNFYELSNSASTPVIAQTNYKKRVIGLYAQATLGWLDRYFLTLTARNDKSSALPDGNNSYFYPSASLSAVVIDNSNTFLKLRGGWARIGNDTGSYQVYATAGQAVNDAYFGDITYPFGGVNSAEIYGRVENLNLKPEITDEIEFGVEGRFFRNRLGIDVALYDRTTKDLIVDLPLPPSTGFNTQTGNYAEVNNKGIELALTAKPVVTDNFTWDLTYTFTKNKGNVNKVNNAEGKINLISLYGVSYYAEEGKPFGTYYGPQPEVTEAGQIIANPNNGQYTYDGEEKYLGSSQRDFIMGLQNSFKYKNLRLGIGIDWKQGGFFNSNTYRLSHFVGNGIETTYNDRNPWIIPNSVVPDGNGGYVENTTPVAWDGVTTFWNGASNEAVAGDTVLDKSFVRLRDVVLSYSMPSKFLSPMGINSLVFSLYGKNLALWTPADNSYVDPETTSFGRGIRSEFGEFSTNPAQRTYGGSVKFSF